MIAIIDIQMGNIRSVGRSLDYVGYESVVTSDQEVIKNASKLILPGVGNFSEASRRLEKSGLKELIRSEALTKKKPILGICLGMQLLVDTSVEDGLNLGLSLIPGRVTALRDRIPEKVIPHMGWNELKFHKKSKILTGIREGECFYFVHSFEVIVDSRYLTATTDYDIDITAIIEHGNIYGTQFHPEKSQAFGLAMIRNFVELC